MESTSERRLMNLRRLAELRGGTVALSSALGLTRGRLSQLIGKHPTSNISEKLARGFEEQLGLPNGWLDEAEPNSSTDEMARKVATVAKETDSALENLRLNLLRLMAEHKLNQSELARRTGMHQKAINRLVAPADQAHSPTLETLEALAQGLSTSVPALLSPDFTVRDGHPGEFLPSPRLATAIGRLIEDFLIASPDDRKMLLETAATAAERAGSKRSNGD